MTDKPTLFKLPLDRIDLTLLPEGARQPGTESFKAAVLAYFAGQYAASGQQAVVAMVKFVLAMLQDGRIREALPYLETLDKARPGNAELLYNLGVAYSELGEYEQAIIRLKKVVQLKPAHALA